MKRILNVGFYLLLVLFGIIFASLNSEPVGLDFFHFGTLQIPLSIVIVMAIGIGVIIGFIVSFTQLMKARREISKLKKSVQLAEKEVANLRTIPIKDNH